MVFYKLNEIPFDNNAKIFKAAYLCQSIPVVIFLGIGITALAIGLRGGIHGIKHVPDISTGSAYGLAAIFGLFGLLFVGIIRASLKPTNWLLRCNSTGIIIKYRSYLNWRLPAEDVQAVGLAYCEIVWVRKVKERRNSPSSGSNHTETTFLTYLDFSLKDTNTSVLESHLAEERKRKCSSMYLDYPLTVLPGGIIRLRWGGITDYFSPFAGKAIKYIGRFVTIAAKDSSKVDLTHNSNLSPTEEDAKVLKLARSGDTLAAVKLTRQIYSCSLNEAVEFVKKLQSKS